MKSYIRNIYRNIGVASRTQAVLSGVSNHLRPDHHRINHWPEGRDRRRPLPESALAVPTTTKGSTPRLKCIEPRSDGSLFVAFALVVAIFTLAVAVVLTVPVPVVSVADRGCWASGGEHFGGNVLFWL